MHKRSANKTSKKNTKQNSNGGSNNSQPRPNILMIMVDQMRFPRFSYGPDNGFVDPLKQIFGFQGTSEEESEFKKFFPGLCKLRNNAVVFNNHVTASAACVPSRSVIFTGQYGTVTGVTQTDGAFKDGMDEDFPWLKGNVPTIGDWMQEAGYTTHYFGKWHVTGDRTNSLKEHGFSDWESSYPDPYGPSHNNLGYYRDYQFSALTQTFLLSQGLGAPYNVASAEANVAEADGKEPEVPSEEPPPWFTVCSFDNPHNIALYPGLPRQVKNTSPENAKYLLTVPEKNSRANLPTAGTMELKLNKLGFPQDNAEVSPTWDEDMSNKPSCQFEATYKVGLSMMAAAGLNVAEAAEEAAKENGESDGLDKDQLLKIGSEMMLKSDILGWPLALTSNPKLACRAFMQYYGYLMHEVDQHINGVLETLEETGQADNTIVIFTSDHGEYGGSHHMMTEKWHSAYEETIHVPMVVRFPPSYYQGETKQITVPTNHIDILPTILGLAEVDADERRCIMEKLLHTHSETYKPVGADLSGLIKGEEDTVIDPATGEIREGVLFFTHDTITEPLDGDNGLSGKHEKMPTKYEIYKEAVKKLKHRAKKDPEGYGVPKEAAQLKKGSITDPSLLHCMVSLDGWKIVRYFSDIEKLEEDNQYELYDLNTDPNEQHNLLVFNGDFPTVIDSDLIPDEQLLTANDIAVKARCMKNSLMKLEKRMLKLEIPKKSASACC